MATWSKQDINVEGRTISAMAPVIVSASRSTDIPAFYADWFFERLKKGYSAWTNPFNGVKSYVSYANTRFIVFWSKNPRPLLDYIDELKERGIGCYIQYTLNDYEAEHLEKVPRLDERIDTFRQLVHKLGVGGVVWRFDPLILTDDITIDDLLRKIENIGDKLQGYTEKLVFSYADIGDYRKVKANLERNGIPYHEWTTELMDEFARRLSQMNREKGWNYEFATCGEKIDIEKYGIDHNRCIDADLIVRRAYHDKELMKFMKVKVEDMPMADFFCEPTLPEGAIMLDDSHYFISVNKKDPGQRLHCGCMAAKDIGEYNTCPHLCEYCYANTSKETAIANWKQHLINPNADTITGR